MKILVRYVHTYDTHVQYHTVYYHTTQYPTAAQLHSCTVARIKNRWGISVTTVCVLLVACCIFLYSHVCIIIILNDDEMCSY